MVQHDHIWNETPEVSDAWRELSASERRARVEGAIATQAAAYGVDEVILPYEATVYRQSGAAEEQTGDDGALLLDIEAHVRAVLGEPIELYYRQRRDENKPRMSREIILDWNERREQMRHQSLGDT